MTFNLLLEKGGIERKKSLLWIRNVLLCLLIHLKFREHGFVSVNALVVSIAYRQRPQSRPGKHVLLHQVVTRMVFR